MLRNWQAGDRSRRITTMTHLEYQSSSWQEVSSQTLPLLRLAVAVFCIECSATAQNGVGGVVSFRSVGSSSAGLAGGLSRTATAPVDRLKMLLQVQEGKMMTLREGVKIMAAEGANYNIIIT